jgi:hypothetical protein
VSKRSSLLFALLIFLTVTAAVVVGNRELLFRTPVHEISDFAVNALQIDRAKHFQELYGNYSRFQFNHPGPAFFYLYGASERFLHDALGLFPSPYNAHLFCGILIQTAFFALALVLLADVLRSPWVVTLGVAIGAAHFTSAPHVFISIWPPEVLLMPFLAFFTACVAVASGRGRAVPWAVLSGSFLVHGHVAQPLFVGVLFISAYATAICSARRAAANSHPFPRQYPVSHAAAIGLLVIFVAPLAIDLASGVQSNAAAILRHLQTASPEDKSVLKSLLYFLSFVSYSSRPEVLVETVNARSFDLLSARPVIFLTWLAALATVVISYWRQRRDPRPEARGFLLLTAFWFGSVALCIVWGLMQTGPMFAFNGHFYFGLHFLIYLAAAFVLTQRLPVRWQRLLAVPAWVVAALTLSWSITHDHTFADSRGLALRETALQALAADERCDRPKLIVFEHDYWSEAASIALALRRAGADFRVGPAWQFMFQSRYVPRAQELGSPELPYSVWRFVRDPHGERSFPVTRGGQHLVFKPAKLSPTNGRIRFDVAQYYQYLVSGVSEPVPADGAWTDHSHAVLQFQPEPAATAVHLHLTAYPFLLDERVSLQPTELWFNDHLVFSAPFIEPGVLRALIPAEFWNERPIATIRLHLPNAHAPARLGLWADTRYLALCLKELRTFADPPAAN